MNSIRALLGTVLVSGALATPASAQVDQRWLPFVGCWEALTESPDSGLLCFRPADGGVEMTSVVDGEVVATELLAADGVARPVVAEGCDGTEAITFSADGRRAFTRSTIECSGDSRSGTGVMAFLDPTLWVDVRALDVQGEKVSWVQEYMLVGRDRLEEEGITDDPSAGLDAGRRLTAARAAASQDIGLDDVREAVAELDTEAVVAWVAAQGTRFAFDAEELLALDAEGVPSEVIDVVVAVSYPDRFVVAPEQDIARAPRALNDRGYDGRRRVPVYFGYRGYLGWDPFYAGFGSGYRYSPWGYRGYGYGGYGYGGYGYGGFYGPTVIRIERAQSGGRVVNGRGWTRGPGDSDTGRRARPRAGSSDSGSGSGSAPAATRGGGSGSGSGTARRARPRGGDGGSGSASSDRRRARPRGG